MTLLSKNTVYKVTLGGGVITRRGLVGVRGETFCNSCSSSCLLCSTERMESEIERGKEREGDIGKGRDANKRWREEDSGRERDRGTDKGRERERHRGIKKREHRESERRMEGGWENLLAVISATQTLMDNVSFRRRSLLTHIYYYIPLLVVFKSCIFWCLHTTYTVENTKTFTILDFLIDQYPSVVAGAP